MAHTGRIIGRQIKGIALITIGIMLILQMFGILDVSFGMYITIILAFWFIAAGIAQFSKAGRIREQDRYDS
jgi:hypothetical protein